MKISKILFIFFISLHINISYSQKIAYIPLYLQDPNNIDGSQFSWDKTAQSNNFIIIWGNTVGIDPTSYSDPDLSFKPLAILDTLETIYQEFKSFGFVDDSEGTNLYKFKIPVVMYNTWGVNGAMGYANGGDADGIIGAFWVHPIAMHSGHVAAHELAHSLQAQSIIDYRTKNGLGSVWNNAGIFWETHANFMRNLLYPSDVSAWGMDLYHVETWGDWKNTYENYELLFALMESDGINIINRLWRESLTNEYPLQAYKRLSDLNQQQFNDKMYTYVRRMPCFDFSYKNIADYFRQYRYNDLINYLPTVQSCYTILQQDSLENSHYQVPIYLAPEEFAYNIIPIYPNPDSCSVIIKFKGHTDINTHAGWRYGFVTTHPDGTLSRYSDTYEKDSIEIAYSLLADESKMYFVVMGAPFDNITTNTTNDTWHGYPKHFRYPYDISIKGGIPEGYQPASEFRSQLKYNGHLHSNGGGWVQNTATVSNSVFLASHSMVLGNSVISGNVRIENTSLVKDANINGNVKITENAFVLGGSYTDNAIIRGQGFAENNTVSDNAKIGMRARVSNYKLYGNIEVGGDVIVYNNSGSCDNGVYYRMTNYYQDNLLECDGRTASHPDNMDVNNKLNTLKSNEVLINCNCANFPDCLNGSTTNTFELNNNKFIYPNPVNNILNFQIPKENSIEYTIQLYNAIGIKVAQYTISQISNSINVSDLASGLYIAKLNSIENTDLIFKLIIQH